MEQGNASISSQIFSSYHLALVGPPLIIVSLFCFGLVLMRQHAVAQFGTTPRPSKPAPSVIQPPSGLPLITEPYLPVLPPVSSSQSNDPEDQVTPQLPGVASSQLQQADQRRESAPGNDNASLQTLLKNSTR